MSVGLPLLNTQVTDFALKTLAKAYNSNKAGRLSDADSASARTAMMVLSIHWEELGAHAFINQQLKAVVADNPHLIATQSNVNVLTSGMQDFGFAVSSLDVWKLLTPPEASRLTALSLLTSVKAVQKLEAQFLARLTGSSNVAGFSRHLNPNPQHLLQVQDNLQWYAGWAGLYVAVVGIACPPCSLAAGIIGIGLGIYGLW